MNLFRVLVRIVYEDIVVPVCEDIIEPGKQDILGINPKEKP